MRRLFLFFPFILLFFSCIDRQPRIHLISPRIGIMGEVLTITGENFGATREESYVTIGGITPTTSSYIEWTDTRILVRIPEFGDSGLVCVYRGNRKSNSALFSNRSTMPQTIQGEYTGIEPNILSIEPPAGAVGSVVTIRGSGFGASREGGGVFFAWDAQLSPSAPTGVSGPGSVEVSETEFGYELWSEREIRVRVPDGAIGGNLTVHTPRGNARPMFFDIIGKPGTKTYKDKRNYAISYAVDIRVQEAEGPNRLYLWLPQPVNSASQRNIRILSRNVEPFIENYRGTSLFQMQNLESNTAAGISLSYLVEVYTVETDIRTNSITIASGNTASLASPVRAAYTAPSSRIPSDDPRIKEQTAALIGREQNPYIRAQRIYEYLLTKGGIQWEELAGGPLEALEEKKADPYRAALLFCTMARSAGIPAIPVSGVLLDRNRMLSRHYWAEFWIDGFGWIPVDPALGAGAAPPSFILRADRANYYFGNLDNQRISFSRGFTTLSHMDPRGRVAVRERDYALQNLWEEAVGGLESYSSLWSDVTINGVYYQ
ncbi:transglutaminase domain-containing protein [Treponema primitia]|uniref:transglutaminase domain-containing protein n=1 Tax=Treponema primitia TaxID=88058 RepID=UPI0002554FEB|nr:transglutaminase domain-containing protein [Treponema primitia]